MTYVAPNKPTTQAQSEYRHQSFENNHNHRILLLGPLDQISPSHLQPQIVGDDGHISADHKTTTHKTRGNTEVFTHGSDAYFHGMVAISPSFQDIFSIRVVVITHFVMRAGYHCVFFFHLAELTVISQLYQLSIHQLKAQTMLNHQNDICPLFMKTCVLKKKIYIHIFNVLACKKKETVLAARNKALCHWLSIGCSGHIHNVVVMLMCCDHNSLMEKRPLLPHLSLPGSIPM